MGRISASETRPNEALTHLPTNPSFSLEGKRALVSGAGRGLGLAAAAALARAGADTVLLARTQGEIEMAAGELAKEGCKATPSVLDLNDLEAVRGFFATQEPFDVLVNNAGTARNKPALETSEDDFDAVMGLNVKSAWTVACLAAEGMIEAGNGGSIINVSSQMGHVSWGDRALYSASKHAMEGFTKGMALEWGGHGIRVNTLCPTFIKTAMTAGFLADEDFHEKVMSKIALGRLGDPEDIMGAVVFLASDASAMVTGSALMVDGGWTAA